VSALHAEVRDPRARLAAAFATRPWMTRLSTTMDADEMTLDPEFRADPGLGEQTSVHVAMLVTECTPAVYPDAAGQRMEMPDGTVVRLREADPSMDADTACRMRGALGASGGCAAVLGVRGAAPSAVVTALVVLALALRRRRRV
jgi:hypothetical protein